MQAQTATSLGTGHPTSEPRRETISGLTKTQAEDLLDWLEAHGCAEREVTWEEGKGFTVRYAPLKK